MKEQLTFNKKHTISKSCSFTAYIKENEYTLDLLNIVESNLSLQVFLVWGNGYHQLRTRMLANQSITANEIKKHLNN